MLQDVRFALRLFARRPGVTALIVTTLAIGIAASTVVFSVADAIVWHPLPFRDPERLVALWSYNPVQKSTGRSIPVASLTAWDGKTQVFETVHAYGMSASLLTGDGDAQGVTGGTASLGLFGALGVYPQVGRDFMPGDFQSSGAPVVLLSDALWRSRFAAARDIVGRTIAIDGQRHTVIGVMPPGFGFPVDSVRLWVPLVQDSRPARVNAIGRMRPRVSFAQAQATAEATSRGMFDAAGHPLPEVRVRPFMTHSANTTTAIVALLGAVTLLLLIAVVNAANILLAEAIRRDAEMSVRASLGGSVARLARQVATETLILTTSAAVIGVALSLAGLQLVLAGLPWMLTFQSLRPIAIDWRALLFACFTAALVGVGAALAPVARVRRASMQSSLKGTAISATSHVRLRSMLVVMQLAVTTVLLVAGGLLANGFVRMNRVDVGFSPAHLLTMSVDLSPTTLPTERAAIIRMVLRDAAAVALIGLAIGLPAAFAASRVLRGLLFGVEPTDPATFAVASVLLVVAALAASYLPARRAGRIDPTEALRYD
jgi:predicted permease